MHLIGKLLLSFLSDRTVEHFQYNSTTSTRSAARVLHLSQTTVWEMLHVNGQHPFHF